jgi:hypothetical protein
MKAYISLHAMCSCESSTGTDGQGLKLAPFFKESGFELVGSCVLARVACSACKFSSTWLFADMLRGSLHNVRRFQEQVRWA